MQHLVHNQTAPQPSECPVGNIGHTAPSPIFSIIHQGQTVLLTETSSTYTIIHQGQIVQPSVSNLSRQDSFVVAGRTTPAIDDGVGKAVKTGRESREKGSLSYLAAEHLLLLKSMVLVKDSFGALESSPEWKQAYKLMLEEYYSKLGTTSRQSVTLKSHFVEFYSAF
jgi:hypothetical protein